MSSPRLTTTVDGMTMNWFVAESLTAERNRELLRADGRRWPDVAHAHRVRAAREIGWRAAGTGPAGVRKATLKATPPEHRLGNLLRGLVGVHPVAQR